VRAGKLDRTIVIERATATVDDYGAPVEAWVPLATVRAQVVQSSTDEYIRDRGASTETTIIFRTRFVEGVTVADRVTYDGKPHDLTQGQRAWPPSWLGASL
jgi:SPP1 family predicted phage head-tail adaptor